MSKVLLEILSDGVLWGFKCLIATVTVIGAASALVFIACVIWAIVDILRGK